MLDSTKVLGFIKSSRVTIALSLFKWLFSIVYSLSTNKDYLYCNTDKFRTCTAVGKDELCEKHGVFDDAYIVAYNYAEAGQGCQVSQSSSQICQTWLFFTMTVFLSNLVHLFIQLYCKSCLNYQFDPQLVVYELIEDDRICEAVKSGFNPIISMIAFFEMWVIAISWSALKVGTICGTYNNSISQTSTAFDFAFLMMTIEGYKINYVHVVRKWPAMKRNALLYSIRIDLTLINLFIICCHAVFFPFVLLYSVFVLPFVDNFNASEIASNDKEARQLSIDL